MLEFKVPFQQFFDLDGDPLTAGYIYTGEIDENPETDPIALYWDAAGTQPAAQPLRTLSGYIVRSGTPAVVYCSEDAYSLTVRDQNRAIVFTMANVSSISNLQAALASSTGAGMIGYEQPGDDGIVTFLDTQLAQLSYTGRVTMLENADGDWIVFNAYGNLIDISASTTDGLQEAIDYATDNGLNLLVIGGGTSRTEDFGIINCTTGIIWPPLRSMKVDLDGVHIVFSAVVTGTGMFFDSLMEVEFNLVGEITYEGNGAPVLFKPTNALPVDTSTVITDSEIKIGTIACVGGTPDCCVQFDPAIASIVGNKFQFLELNGSGAIGSPSLADHGIEIVNPGAYTVWSNNIVDIADIHHVTLSGVQEGVSATNQANLACNIYRIGKLTPKGGASSSGFNSYGIDSITQISSITPISSTIQYGVVLHSGSSGHQIQVGSISGYSATAVNDSGTLNTVSHDGAVYVGGVRSFLPLLGAYTPINNVAGVTLTAAMLMGQIISHTGAVAVTDTTDTATNIITAIPGAFSGFYFWVKIMNFNSGTLTISPGVGVTQVGASTIAAGATRDFMIFIDNVSLPACHIFG